MAQRFQRCDRGALLSAALAAEVGFVPRANFFGALVSRDGSKTAEAESQSHLPAQLLSPTDHNDGPSFGAALAYVGVTASPAVLQY